MENLSEQFIRLIIIYIFGGIFYYFYNLFIDQSSNPINIDDIRDNKNDSKNDSKHGEEYIEPEECPICYENYTTRIKLSCGHFIHYKCMLKWGINCPLCRVGAPSGRLDKRILSTYSRLNSMKKRIEEELEKIEKIEKIE